MIIPSRLDSPMLHVSPILHGSKNLHQYSGIYVVILSKGNLPNPSRFLASTSPRCGSCARLLRSLRDFPPSFALRRMCPASPREPASVHSVVKNPASKSHFTSHPQSAAIINNFTPVTSFNLSLNFSLFF